MASLYIHQEKNITKTWLLLAVFFGLVMGVGWIFAAMQNNPSILIFAVVFAVIINFGAYWFSDTIVLSMVHAQRIEKKEDASELWNIVENLCIASGLPMPALYVIDDPSPNAFATGRNPKHAALAVHTGLLRILNKNELEGVVAHELAHIGNRDTLIATLAVILAGMVAIASDWMMRSMIFGNRDSEERGGSPVVIILGIAIAILAPLFATLLRLAVSRKREFLADATAGLMTRYPEGLASALEKISSAHIPVKDANSATATLYISNPFVGSSKFLNNLFSTHPPIEDRIHALRTGGGQMNG
jgi:heat shock protein HtpX